MSDEDKKALFFIALAFSVARKIGANETGEWTNFQCAGDFLKAAKENEIPIKDIFA